MAGLGALLVASALGAASGGAWSADSFGLELPLRVVVALVGLDDDADVPAAALQQLLEQSLPRMRPSVAADGEPLDTSYTLEYRVAHVSESDEAMLHNVLADAMTLADAAARAYDVDVARLDGAYRELCARVLGEGAGWSDAPGGGGGGEEQWTYVVFVQRLSHATLAARLRARQRADVPDEGGAGWAYRYRLERGAPAQAFVGAGRYLVADLSAGPCALGRTDSEAGTVDELLLPRLPPAPPSGAGGAERRAHSHRASAAAASIVLSAVRFVLAPSVRSCARGCSLVERVLLMLTGLRNHDDFPSLPLPAQDEPGAVHTALLKANLDRLALPTQHIELFVSTHPLHTHPQVSVALSRARRAATSHELHQGRFTPVARPYTDAADLFAHLARARDALGAELLLAAGVDEAEEGEAGLAGGAASGEGMQGALLVPIYLISLAGEDAPSLLRTGVLNDEHAHASAHVRAGRTRAHAPFAAEQGAAAPRREEGPMAGAHATTEHGLLATSADAVAIMQPNVERLRLGYFSADGAETLVDGRRADRHVLAGVLAVVGALLPPYQTYSEARGEVVAGYMWATGAQPFGPFSASASPSDIVIDVARRNQLLCQLRESVAVLREVEAAVDRFAHDFLRAEGKVSAHRRALLRELAPAARGAGSGGAAGGAGAGAGGAAGFFAEEAVPQWALHARAAWDARASLPDSLAKRRVVALMGEFRRLRSALGAAIADLGAGAGGALRAEGLARLRALAGSVGAFAAHCDAELTQARAELACCTLVHSVSLPITGLGWALLGATAAALAVGVGLCTGWGKPRAATKRAA